MSMSPQQGVLFNRSNKENSSHYANQLHSRNNNSACKHSDNFTPINKSHFFNPFEARPKLKRTPMIHNNAYFKSSSNSFRNAHPFIAQSPAINSHSFFIPNTPQ